jgi:hypothetical protein
MNTQGEADGQGEGNINTKEDTDNLKKEKNNTINNIDDLTIQ